MEKKFLCRSIWNSWNGLIRPERYCAMQRFLIKLSSTTSMGPIMRRLIVSGTNSFLNIWISILLVWWWILFIVLIHENMVTELASLQLWKSECTHFWSSTITICPGNIVLFDFGLVWLDSELCIFISSLSYTTGLSDYHFYAYSQSNYISVDGDGTVPTESAKVYALHFASCDRDMNLFLVTYLERSLIIL